MYDLILCVIATAKSTRLQSFQKIGFKDSGRYRTKIVYLSDTEDRPDCVTRGEWLDCSAATGTGYTSRFVHYLKETSDEAKWFFQVDDDSCTDFDKTIELLEYFYDHDDPVALTGSFSFHLAMPRYLDQSEDDEPCFSYNISPKMQAILKDMEIENLFMGRDNLNYARIMPLMTRGWEHSVFSRAAVKKIKKYGRLQEYVSRCTAADPEFSDQVPFVLARLAKVPIAPCFFLTPTPSIEEYTAINKTGRFSHIHHICEPWGQLKNFEQVIEDGIIFENSGQIEAYFDSIKENTDWFFFHVADQKIRSRCLIRLLPGGGVKIIETRIWELVAWQSVPEFNMNINESGYDLEGKRWGFDPGSQSFTVLNEDGREVVFEKMNEKLYAYRISDSEAYLLSRIHILDSVFWSKGQYIGKDLSRIN